jgi:hypothetical protein
MKLKIQVNLSFIILLSIGSISCSSGNSRDSGGAEDSVVSVVSKDSAVMQKDKSFFSNNLIGCWESDMSDFKYHKVYLQFQSDSIVQSIQEDKSKGVWQIYFINDTLHLSITWENTYEPTDYTLNYITNDSLSLDDEWWGKIVYKRSLDKSGNILYNNPIFKLDFQKSENVSTESDQNYDYPSIFKLPEESINQTKTQIKTECYKCHGSGKQTCWHCNGTGEVKCENCYGTGIYNYTGKTCNQCNGNGKHYCKDCNGNGIDGICYNCRGEGFIYQ